MEGFFFPDSYIVPRETSVDQLLDIIARNFTANLTTDIQNGFIAQNLSVLQAVTIASIVEREAIHRRNHRLLPPSISTASPSV
jgi:UPF0755 protein